MSNPIIDSQADQNNNAQPVISSRKRTFSEILNDNEVEQENCNDDESDTEFINDNVDAEDDIHNPVDDEESERRRA